jgi:hypothetical protein
MGRGGKGCVAWTPEGGQEVMIEGERKITNHGVPMLLTREHATQAGRRQRMKVTEVLTAGSR